MRFITRDLFVFSNFSGWVRFLHVPRDRESRRRLPQGGNGPAVDAFFAFSFFPCSTLFGSLHETYWYFRTFLAGFVFLRGQRDRRGVQFFKELLDVVNGRNFGYKLLV